MYSYLVTPAGRLSSSVLSRSLQVTMIHATSVLGHGTRSSSSLRNQSTSIISRKESKRSFTSYRNPAQHYQLVDQDAVSDLFAQYAKKRDGVLCLDCDDIRALRAGIGEDPGDDAAVSKLFDVADWNGDGYIDFEEFLENAHTFLQSNPARILLVVGGPGSGKGSLCRRLAEECRVVHLSSGDLLREEVQRQTQLGKQVQEIMARGELVSSATIVALMKRRMRNHPGKRVLLDGFPRSLENAHDLVALCGRPELALHLMCDDTVMLERIMSRGESSAVRREDDNFQTAIQRIRTYHKFHHSTMEWLHQQHVPVVNLDCSGTPESIWNQLVAIGKLMRPAVQLPIISSSSSSDAANAMAGMF